MERPTYEMPYHPHNADDDTSERDESSFETADGTSETADEREAEVRESQEAEASESEASEFETREPGSYPSDVLDESDESDEAEESDESDESDESEAVADVPEAYDVPETRDDAAEAYGDYTTRDEEPMAAETFAAAEAPTAAAAAPPFVAEGTGVTEATPELPETLDFGPRWHEIKASFVDDPRQAVEQADALVEDAVNALTTHRKALSDRWQNTDTDDTEQLRLTLREYHALFDRLNSGK